MPFSLVRSARVTLTMIKFSHTVFALPFALMGALLAARSLGQRAPSWPVLGWILLCMAGARTAAMTCNRIADRAIDARNPRTAGRPLVTGELSPGFAWIVLALSSAVFLFGAAQLNRLAFLLSPFVLLFLFAYSFTKRFTSLAHFVLGAGLGLAPCGAWVAVTGGAAWPPAVLGLAVLCWVAGFDLIYACQDTEVDRREGLHSVPARTSIATALRLSSLLHGITVGLLAALAPLAGLGAVYLGGVGLAAVLLLWEHTLVKPHDLSRVNAAFFTVNGWVGIALLAATAADLWRSAAP